MKRILTLAAVLCCVLAVRGQVCIKMEHGVGTSWTSYSTAARTNYIAAIGLDYLERTHFMLSSKVSFFTRRNLYPVYVAYGMLGDMDVSITYWSLDTTARWKRKVGVGNVFVGVGPSFDFKRSAESVALNKTSDFIADDFVLSVLAEVGYFVDIRHCRIGMSVAYRNNLTTINTVARRGFISHLLSCSLGVGYVF